MIDPNKINLEKSPDLVKKEEAALEKKVQSAEEKTFPQEEKAPELEKKTEGLEQKLTSEKEIVKPELKEENKEGEGASFNPAEPPSAKAQQEAKKIKQLDQENQIKSLSDLAFQKGLDFAIEVAKNLDNAYVLDQFHDNLVGQLRQRLIEQGKLKRI